MIRTDPKTERRKSQPVLRVHVRLLGGGYDYDSTAIRPPFDSRSAASRQRCDHSTTYVTTGLLYRGLNA